MELLDVNVLVGAHREDAPNHGQLRRWLEQTIRSEAPSGWRITSWPRF